MKKRNKYIKYYIFIVFLTVLILSAKFLGYRGRANLYSSDFLSWKEILNNLPIYIIGSIIFTFGILRIYDYASTQQKQDIEKTKKIITEREKKERNNVSDLSKSKTNK